MVKNLGFLFVEFGRVWIDVRNVIGCWNSGCACLQEFIWTFFQEILDVFAHQKHDFASVAVVNLHAEVFQYFFMANHQWSFLAIFFLHFGYQVFHHRFFNVRCLDIINLLADRALFSVDHFVHYTGVIWIIFITEISEESLELMPE
jgi:hypothetical protein